MILTKDFKEFIESLNANEVRYLVVGGYAVAYHGHPRGTADFDLWVEPSDSNLNNLVKALKDFGFESLELTTDDFKDPEGVVQLGHPPYRIDILTDLPDVDFEQCFNIKDTGDFDGVKVAFIDLLNLIKTKRATGRYQDLADVEYFENIKPE